MDDHPHRQELLLAVREHDNGWREADAVPRIDSARQQPLDFREIAAQDRIEIWRRGVRRFGSERPRVALLIMRHAAQLHEQHRNQPDWDEFFDELDELRLAVEDSSGIEPSAIERDYRFLDIADTLSLGACGALGSADSQPSTVGGYRFRAELGRIALAPFPLAGATTLQVAYRVMSSTGRASSAEFSRELATTPWRRRAVHVVPL